MKTHPEIEKIVDMIKVKSREQLICLLKFNQKNSSFIELELEICKSLNEIGAMILEQLIPLIYGDGYEGSKVDMNPGAVYSCIAADRPRGLLTAFGKITIHRAAYTEFDSGGLKSFIDEALDIENKRISPLVRYWSDLLGTCQPFDEAASTLQKIRGINLSKTQIELSTESIGAKITNAHDEQIKDIKLNKKGEVSPAKVNLNLNSEKTVYIETDGCHINTKNDWKECKTFMLFELEETEKGERKLKNKRYYSTMKDVNELKRQLKFYLEQYCAQDEVRIACIGDGAKWIWNIMAELFPRDVFPSGIIEIVDWYHAKEKLVEIRNEIFGDAEEGRKFLDECESYLFKGNIEVIEQLLVQLRNRQELSGKKKFVDDKLYYFMNNKDKMRYEMFKEKQLCIGSGAIESANKYVVQKRLKEPGMKWNEENANYMAHLRAEYINGDLEKHYGLKHNALVENVAT